MRQCEVLYAPGNIIKISTINSMMKIIIESFANAINELDMANNKTIKQ